MSRGRIGGGDPERRAHVRAAASSNRLSELDRIRRAVGGDRPGLPGRPAGRPGGAQLLALLRPRKPWAGPRPPLDDLGTARRRSRRRGTLDPSSPNVSIPDPGAYPEPGKPGRVHLAWTGSICDSRITVTVAADLKSITFDMGPQPTCDSLGVVREVVLDFLGPVDVSAIEISLATAI